MPVQVKIDKQREVVVIELPMERARPSATGKTILIATSHGLASGEAVYSGRPVMVAASAFVYPIQSSTIEEKKSEKSRHRAYLDLDRPRKVSNGKMKTEKASAKKQKVRNVEP